MLPNTIPASHWRHEGRGAQVRGMDFVSSNTEATVHFVHIPIYKEGRERVPMASDSRGTPNWVDRMMDSYYKGGFARPI